MQRAPVLFMLFALSLAQVGCGPALKSSQRARLHQFDAYWKSLEKHYPYFDRLDISWPSRRAQFRAAATYAESDLEFFHVIAGMVSELDDPHVSFDLPEGFMDREKITDFEGRMRMLLNRGRLTIVQWPDSQPPTPPHWVEESEVEVPGQGRMRLAPTAELVRVEGFPAHPGTKDVLIAGYPGTRLELDLRWPDGTITRHYLIRPEYVEPEKPEGIDAGVLDEPQDETDPASRARAAAQRACRLDFVGLADGAFVKPEAGLYRIAWVRITTFSFGTELEREAFKEVLGQVLAEARQADGVMLDLRSNFGGSAAAAGLLVERFVKEPYREYLDANAYRSEMGPIMSLMMDFVLLEGRYVPWVTEPTDTLEGPLVVLANERTASAAENAVIALQRCGGAIVIGEPTMGAGAGVIDVEGRFGGVLRFGAGRIVDFLGRDIQDVGVIPNVAVTDASGTLRQSPDGSRALAAGRAEEDAYRAAAAQVFWTRLEARPGPALTE